MAARLTCHAVREARAGPRRCAKKTASLKKGKKTDGGIDSAAYAFLQYAHSLSGSEDLDHNDPNILRSPHRFRVP